MSKVDTDVVNITQGQIRFLMDKIKQGGGGGPTVVQTTGTSTTDVMSQNATTNMIYPNNSNSTIIIAKNFGGLTNRVGDVFIGANTDSGAVYADYKTSIGSYSRSLNSYSTALGASAAASGEYSIALGSYSKATQKGQLDVSTTRYSASSTNGYNNSPYRLITGVYPGQSAHDAATLAQGNTLSSTAPTTSTEGVLGQLFTDTTNMHTYQCTNIDTTDPNNPVYTWTQRW